MNWIVGLAIGAVAGILLGILTGILIRKKIGEKAIGSAEDEAKKIREVAAKDAESMKIEALLSAKEDILRQRNEAEKELKERRSEVSRQERRIAQKEENLDKKMEGLERKNEQLDRKIKENEVAREQIDELLKKEMVILENISGITAEEAKEELIERVESEVKHELSQRLAELEEQFKEEADSKAKNIISLDLQQLDGAICSHFVICNADSTTQVSAIADAIEEDVFNELGQKVWRVDGKMNSLWVAMDYTDIIVHIFQTEMRDFYKLEELWADAPCTRYEYEE